MVGERPPSAGGGQGRAPAASAEAAGPPLKTPRETADQEVMQALLAPQAAPKDKYQEPMTSAHDIGWNLTALWPSRWSYPRNTCDVCDYAQIYQRSNGRSPFANKDAPITTA
mmetsp:Transcript_27332/g.61714  ORF Transcript_27332/g.61714 Transcript_27332/m.61714 type:complete len:112 (+) Transcript_27332:282-617(+)